MRTQADKWLAGFLVFFVCACVEPLKPNEYTLVKTENSQALKTLAQGRIFFGHQSVGEDILNGLRDLLAEHPSDANSGAPYALSILDVQGQDSLPSRGYILHTKVGENTKPASKCADFARLLEKYQGQIDVAVLKYCYVDVVGSSDAESLFADYSKQLQTVSEKHPGITLIPATVPLTVSSERPDWARKNWEVKVRRLFGFYDRNDADNVKRARFNELLRKAYAGKRLLDIAKIESTYPDGRREGFSKGGQEVPSLIPAYTHDGGHLNEAGRKLVAEEFIQVLAASLPASGAKDSSDVSKL